jgi:hypothetical protein
MRIDGSQATSLRNSHMFLKHLDTWSPAHGIMIAISKNSRHAKMWSLGHYRPRSTGRIVRRRTHPTAACEGGRVCLYQVPSPAVKDRRTSCPVSEIPNRAQPAESSFETNSNDINYLVQTSNLGERGSNPFRRPTFNLSAPIPAIARSPRRCLRDRSSPARSRGRSALPPECPTRGA